MRILIVTLLLLSVAMGNECQKASEYYKKRILASVEDALVYYVNRAEIDKASNPIEAIQDFKYIQKTYGITLQTLEVKGFKDEIVCIIKPSFDEMPKASYAEVKSAVVNLDMDFVDTDILGDIVDKAMIFYPILKKHNLPLVKELLPYKTGKHFKISGVADSKEVTEYLKIKDVIFNNQAMLTKAYEVIGDKVLSVPEIRGIFGGHFFCKRYESDSEAILKHCKDNEECISKYSQTFQDIDNFVCEKNEAGKDDSN